MRRMFLLCLLFLAGCSTSNSTATIVQPGAGDFEKLSNDLTYGGLGLSPVSATQAGYHVHDGVPLDELLDDYSAAGIDKQRSFYEGFRNQVNAFNAASLDKEQS